MSTTRVLYIVASAAPPVLDLAPHVQAARERGFEPLLTLTPHAADWIPDLAGLGRDLGIVVRHADRRPGELRPFPDPDAVLATPCTFNTLNKWALGISDNTALGTLAGSIGAGIPAAAIPYFKDDLGRHPAVRGSTATLAEAGVHVLERCNTPDLFEVRCMAALDWLRDAVGER